MAYIAADQGRRLTMAALFIVFKGGFSSGGRGFVPGKIFEILVCCR